MLHTSHSVNSATRWRTHWHTKRGGFSRIPPPPSLWPPVWIWQKHTEKLQLSLSTTHTWRTYCTQEKSSASYSRKASWVHSWFLEPEWGPTYPTSQDLYPSITKADECAMKKGNRPFCAYDRVEMKSVNTINNVEENGGQAVDDQLLMRKRSKKKRNAVGKENAWIVVDGGTSREVVSLLLENKAIRTKQNNQKRV